MRTTSWGAPRGRAGAALAAAVALLAVSDAAAAPLSCPLTRATFAPLQGPPGLALTVRDGEQGPVWRLAWTGSGRGVVFSTVFQSGNGHTILVEERDEGSPGEPVETRAEVFDDRLSALNLPRAVEEPGRRLAAYALLPGLRDGLARQARDGGPSQALPAQGLWVVAACEGGPP